MLIHYAVVALLALILAAPADAQVRVDIGINLPAPPPLVVVPGVPSVHYAPHAPGNFFFYGGQYWVFTPAGWHVSRRYDGPWIFVAPQFVPRPVLAVPVRYYHVPPGHWKHWHGHAPPHWEREWGHEWADRRAWKHHHTHRGLERGDIHDESRAEGHGRGHGRGR